MFTVCTCALIIYWYLFLILMQMLDEFQRILNNDGAVAEARRQWMWYVPRIISQAKLENSTRIVARRTAMIVDEDDGTLT